MLVSSRLLCVGCGRIVSTFSRSTFHRTARLNLLLQRRNAASVPGSNIVVSVPKDRLVPQDSEIAQPVALEDLPRAQQRFAKQFEDLNYLRIKEIFRKNKKNIIGFVVLSCLVASIYGYTVYAVKQETFLEEIDKEVAEEKGEMPPRNFEK